MADEGFARDGLRQPGGKRGSPSSAQHLAPLAPARLAGVSFRTAKALAIVEADYSSPRLDLERISRQVGVSKSHFCRVFRRELGVGFPKYLRMLRARRAETLLRETMLSVKEVAAAVGFDYVVQLDRAFRAGYACSPSEYRAREGLNPR